MIQPATQALDLTHFPLVVLVLPPTIDGTYADVLEHDTRLLLARRERYVSVSDAYSVSALPDAKTRKQMGEWTKSHEDDFRRWQVANALLVGSSLVRAGISAIHWLAPPPVPTAVETDLAVGLEFLRGHAKRAGVSTSGIEAFARARQVRLTAS